MKTSRRKSSRSMSPSGRRSSPRGVSRGKTSSSRAVPALSANSAHGNILEFKIELFFADDNTPLSNSEAVRFYKKEGSIDYETEENFDPDVECTVRTVNNVIFLSYMFVSKDALDNWLEKSDLSVTLGRFNEMDDDGNFPINGRLVKSRAYVRWNYDWIQKAPLASHGKIPLVSASPLSRNRTPFHTVEFRLRLFFQKSKSLKKAEILEFIGDEGSADAWGAEVARFGHARWTMSAEDGILFLKYMFPTSQALDEWLEEGNSKGRLSTMLLKMNNIGRIAYRQGYRYNYVQSTASMRKSYDWMIEKSYAHLYG
jgi:hypothetical protein